MAEFQLEVESAKNMEIHKRLILLLCCKVLKGACGLSAHSGSSVIPSYRVATRDEEALFSTRQQIPRSSAEPLTGSHFGPAKAV